MNKIFVPLLIAIFVTLAAGCQTAGGTKITGTDRDAILAFSEPKTDNLMAGLNAKDYAMFSKDFDQDMQTAMSADQFKALKRDRDAKLGPYISRTVKEVYKRDAYYTVIYNTVFEADPDVVMRVVFQADDPHGISGLWFDK